MHRRDLISPEQLLKAVRTWSIKSEIQYRGFKCGNCRKRLRRAWHYWLDKGAFSVPVHLCPECRKKLIITYPACREKFSLPFINTPGFKKALGEIFALLPKKRPAVYKQFSCDYCQREIFKANHIFFKGRGKLSELHLCPACLKKMPASNKFAIKNIFCYNELPN